MTKRKFYRTVIQVEILSEEPVSFDDLYAVHIFGEEEGSIQTMDLVSNQEVDGFTMAKLLERQFSDPSLFGLTEDGEDDHEEEEDDG